MPIYEYHCEKCGNEFELMESFEANHEKKCPECQGTAKRKISASAFHLKGGGWYTSDYKNKPEAKPKACDAKPSPACSGCTHAQTPE